MKHGLVRRRTLTTAPSTLLLSAAEGVSRAPSGYVALASTRLPSQAVTRARIP